MKQQMMEIGRWIKAHPLKGTLWLLVFVGVAACAALFERYELALGAVFFLLLMPFAVFYRRDVTKLKAVALILAAAVFLNALPAHAAEPPQPPQRVGCAVVIVVIIGIGIVTYFVVKKMADRKSVV